MPVATVRLQHAADGDILISEERLPEGVWAEIGSLLLSHGASPSSQGYSLTVLTLRLAANELGEVLLRHNIKPSYDESTRRLLRAHISEFQARIQAEQDRSGLPESEVVRQVTATGRFTRALTNTQRRDLTRLLRLPHGANFSVPGAGKTASLLAIYEASRGIENVDRLLVVAPKNAFLSWEDEVSLCYTADRPVIARIAGELHKRLMCLRRIQKSH